ncbi:GIY-YIG nuclease family protein [Phytohalomonas tamaricis]|uniref:GIY-YIG nuclease family protein n=1 Tax=Phytohalomonas tamaricis TaxID=2081032 RepID=UPI0021D40CC8|nr:GIY-YIG nuclease family protein [Phytohalomonas tamaricis]
MPEQEEHRRVEPCWSLYIIETSYGHLYTGITTDITRRFAEHQSGKRGARALRGKGPLQLRFHCEVGDKSRALKLEYALKRRPRHDKQALIAGECSLAMLFEYGEAESNLD